MPSQDTQYDQTLGTYKNDAHAEVALSAYLYELNKDWPLTGQYEFSIPIGVAANSRRNMKYTVSYDTGDVCIYEPRTLNLGDNQGVWVDIGYYIFFYGAWYTKVFITSNGFVTFDPRAYNDNGGKWTSPNPASIPTANDPNAILAPFWRDLDPSKGGTIQVGLGTRNEFAVVWRNVPNKANSNTQTFALYFDTTPCSETSYIAFVYGSITNDVPTSIGIEDQSGKQGETVASVSSGKLVSFADSPDNYYRITKIKVSMSKLTASGANDDKAIIWVQGWEESRPGGTNVILEDPSEGKYDVPQIYKVAAFLVGTAGLLSGYGWISVAGYLADASILAYELSPMPRGTTVHEAMESTKTAYVESAAMYENYPLPIFNWACDVSISPLIRWQLLDPSVTHRLIITAQITVKKPDGTTYTLTTDSLELKLFPSPPNTPSKPSGPTVGYERTWYSYYTSTTDPNGDSVRYEFDWGDGKTTWTGWYASGATAKASHSWAYAGTYYIKVRAQDSGGLYSDWSQSLQVVIKVGCPTLFVWNGSEYVEEGVLNIHADSDVTVQHRIEGTLVPNGYFYRLSLRELDEFTSHIDYVKLYAVGTNGEWYNCYLVKAVHSELGYVTASLLFDDDRRVDLTPQQTIDLTFLLPQTNEIAYFIFEINGYNAKIE